MPDVARNTLDDAGQYVKFPASRYMGSKRRLLPQLKSTFESLQFDTALDAFSGGGSVSYLLKSLGKSVDSNDYLAYGKLIAQAAVENQHVILDDADVDMLITPRSDEPTFIRDTFDGLFLTPEDNAFLDRVSGNISQLTDPYKNCIARAALCRSALKKQPRGVFTVTGRRYDDGRADLRRSMGDQFRESVADYNAAVFDSGRPCHALNGDIMRHDRTDYDLVYFDPPYYSPHSDNDYLRRYHFIEGLATYWTDAPIIQESRTKRLERRPTVFSSKRGIYTAFETLFSRFAGSTLVVSYSSNSLPSKDEMAQMLKRHSRSLEVLEADLTYSFGTHSHKVGSNRNAVQEYLFIAQP